MWYSCRRTILAVLGTLICSVAWAENRLPSDVNLDELRRAIRSPLGGGYPGRPEFLEDAVIDAHVDRIFWLVVFKPAASGIYPIQHHYKFRPIDPEKAVGQKLSLPVKGMTQYHIAVGRRGTPRTITQSYSHRISPDACVGDTVILPINISPWLTDHEFVWSTNSPYTFTRLENELAKKDKDPAIPKLEHFDVKSRLNPQLSLTDSWMTRMPMRIGGWFNNTAAARFEASDPGRFNIRIEPIKGLRVSEDRPIVILPKSSSVPCLIRQAYVSEIDADFNRRGGSDYFPLPNPTHLSWYARVGDEIILRCSERQIQESDNSAFPAATITRQQFKPFDNPFERFILEKLVEQ